MAEQKKQEQSKDGTKFWFKVDGNLAVVEFEKFLRLSFAGKKMIRQFMKKELASLGFYVRDVVLGKLAEYGYQRDDFFSGNVTLPKAFVREPKPRRHGFLLADLTSK